MRIGSLPDFPTVSEKIYSSMITSPTTKTFNLESLFIKLFISLIENLFLNLRKKFFCSLFRLSKVELIIFDELNDSSSVKIIFPPFFFVVLISTNNFYLF